MFGALERLPRLGDPPEGAPQRDFKWLRAGQLSPNASDLLIKPCDDVPAQGIPHQARARVIESGQLVFEGFDGLGPHRGRSASAAESIGLDEGARWMWA